MTRARSLALATIAAAGTAWTAQRRADRRAVASDPDHAALGRRLRGRTLPVVAPDGTPLHVEVFGPDDAPTVVLVHGWTCAAHFWTRQIQALRADVRVVAYDLRGHGRSGRAQRDGYSIEAHAGDLDAVLRAAARGDGRPPLVAGHSLGAMALVAWAGGRPPAEVGERLAAAALVNAGVGDLISESMVLRAPTRLAAAEEVVGRAVLSARAPLPGGPSPVSHRAVRYVALSRSASPAQVAFCERLVLECPRDVRAACGGTLSRVDLEEAVAHLDVPTTVIAGAADRLTPPGPSRRLAAALPRVERELVIPRAGHMCPVSDHEAVSAELRRLVADRASERAGAEAHGALARE